MNYGNIEQLLKEKGISKNKICRDLNIPRTNFNKYCRNDFQRMDAFLLCKLCYYLDVDISTLITYIPPLPSEQPVYKVAESNPYCK